AVCAQRRRSASGDGTEATRGRGHLWTRKRLGLASLLVGTVEAALRVLAPMSAGSAARRCSVPPAERWLCNPTVRDAGCGLLIANRVLPLRMRVQSKTHGSASQ